MKTLERHYSASLALILSVSLQLLFGVPAMFGATIHVKAGATGSANGSSWVDAFPELQSALAHATAEDEIWVAVGTYRPDFDTTTGQHTHARNRTFRILDGFALYGGFAGSETSLDQRARLFAETILDGDLLGNDVPGFTNYSDNTYHVVTAMDILDSNTVFDGFKIRGGYAGGTAIYDMRAGGMYVIRGMPLIKNCIFAENWAYGLPAGEGGGLHIVSSDRTVVDSCSFIGNRAINGGGLYVRYNSTPIIRDCIFSENESGHGAGCRTFVSDPEFFHCDFRNNHASGDGGAVDVYGGQATFEDCDFIGNTAGSGGGLQTDGQSVFLQRCLFEGNSAGGYGGAIMQDCINCTADITLVNCLLRNNTPEAFMNLEVQPESPPTRLIGCTFVNNGQGFWNYNSWGIQPVEIVNSVFWNNGDHDESWQIYDWDEMAITINHCDVQGWTGGFGGANNTGIDPLFFGAGSDAYRLSRYSPCIDAGDTDYALLQGPTDIDGHSRVCDGDGDGYAAVDVGVDEYVLLSYLCGDVNADGTVDVSDAVYIISYIFAGGPAPLPLEAGDVNNDQAVDISDAVYLIQYIFGGGPAPCGEQ